MFYFILFFKMFIPTCFSQQKDFQIVTFLNGPYKDLLYNFVCNLETLDLKKYLHVFAADSTLNHFFKSEKVVKCC